MRNAQQNHCTGEIRFVSIHILRVWARMCLIYCSCACMVYKHNILFVSFAPKTCVDIVFLFRLSDARAHTSYVSSVGDDWHAFIWWRTRWLPDYQQPKTTTTHTPTHTDRQNIQHARTQHHRHMCGIKAESRTGLDRLTLRAYSDFPFR